MHMTKPPYQIGLSYPPGHCDCFGSGHLTWAGPIKILPWDFFSLSGSMWEYFSLYLCCKKAESICWFYVSHQLEKLRDWWERLKETSLVSYCLILFLDVFKAALVHLWFYELPKFVSNKSPFCLIWFVLRFVSCN